MTGKHLRLGLFAAAAILQVSVPAAMIGEREWVLHTGEAVRLRTAPVDPYDAFRGRYVALDFDLSRVDVGGDHEFRKGEEIFLLLHADADGFAAFAGLSRIEPGDGTYIHSRIHGIGSSQVHLELPFDRFYMEETRASRAEALYRRSNTRQERAAFALVRVRAGKAVLEDLYVGGVPIDQALETER